MRYNKSLTSTNRGDYYEQQLRLLTYCEPFQKYVEMLRAKWNVPDELIHTHEEYQDWLKSFRMSEEYVKSEITYVRRKNPSQRKIRIYPFERDLKSFANQFDLHQSTTPALHSYILHDEFDYKNFGENIRRAIFNQNPLIFSEPEPNHRKKMFMEIFGDTKLKDIQGAYGTHIEPDFIWMDEPQTKKLTYKITDEGLYKRLIVEIPKGIELQDLENFWDTEIKKILPQLRKLGTESGRRQRTKTFDRDEKIYQLREIHAYRYKNIAEKINNEFACDLDDEEARDRYRKFKKKIAETCSKS